MASLDHSHDAVDAEYGPSKAGSPSHLEVGDLPSEDHRAPTDEERGEVNIVFGEAIKLKLEKSKELVGTGVCLLILGGGERGQRRRKHLIPPRIEPSH